MALFTYPTIDYESPVHIGAIDVSILKVAPLPTVEKMPYSAPPVVAPRPVSNLQIKLQAMSAQNRSITAHIVKSRPRSAPSLGAVNTSVSQPRALIAKVFLSSSAPHRPAASLGAVIDLPVQPNPLLISSLSAVPLSVDGAARGNRRGFGKELAGSGVNQARMDSLVGLISLIASAGAASVEDSLADVTDNIALGDGTPELPKDTPCAIIQGRGRGVTGSINLVRFADILHPSEAI